MKSLEVLFSPAEFQALKNRELRGITCIVFDVLRATSTIVTALANGARSVRAVETIEEALAEKRSNPRAILAGERDGFRITARQTGSINFELGNSAREFTPDNVRHRHIVITTTNGSRAIASCSHADNVLIASFLNMGAIQKAVGRSEKLLIICSGTHEEASYEDTLAAGTLCELLWPALDSTHIADSAQIARNIRLQAGDDLLAAMKFARNGRRLLSIPELRDDVPFCLRSNVFDLAPALNPQGLITI